MIPRKTTQPKRLPTHHRVTIQEVADAAGVSPATVSQAINERGRVAARTREHVRDVAKRVGYVPNRAARSLASGQTHTIGLSLPRMGSLPLRDLLSREWYGHLMVSVSQRATERRYAVAVLPDFLSLGDCYRNPVDGVVVLDPIVDDPRLELLREAGVVHVALGDDPRHSDVPHVAPDTAAGIRDLLTHLGERGARQILLLVPAIPWHLYAESMEAARVWSRTSGIPVDRRVVGDWPLDHERLMTAASHETRIALGSSEPPDAIVGLLDGFGASILVAAMSMGRKVPGDVRVAQDIDGSSTHTVIPAITALDLHPELLAHAAVDLLLDSFERHTSERAIIIPSTLCIRAST